MTYLLLFAACIVSPFMGFAEPLAVYFGATGTLSLVPAVIAIGAGQTVGFTLLYLFGTQIRARVGWLRRRFEAFDFARLGRGRTAMTATAGMIGLPPANLLSLAGPMYDPRMAMFTGTLLVTRVLRFGVLAGLPAVFGAIFDPELAPAWVQGLLGG